MLAPSVSPTIMRLRGRAACGIANVLLVEQSTQSHTLASGWVDPRKVPICVAWTQRPCAAQHA